MLPTDTEPVVLHQGDALSVLRRLPDRCVQCCATSPPYYGLRDYGADGQIGLEPTPAEYVARLVDVFREARRVLRDDGVLWLNLGDSYTTTGEVGRNDGGGPGRTLGQTQKARSERRSRAEYSSKPKDLLGIPWSVAFALRDDGWTLRQDIIWAKANPMPESVRDRCTKSHEYVFLLAKNARYFFDAEAIKEPAARPGDVQTFGGQKALANDILPSDPRYRNGSEQWGREVSCPESRNRRSVWNVNPVPYPGAHFAVWPPALVEPMILAGTSAKGQCPACGSPWRRGESAASAKTTGWEPPCSCPPADPVPQIVLDPFAGSGTTLAVAARLGRHGIGIDLSAEYLELARKRLAEPLNVGGLFGPAEVPVMRDLFT